MAQRTARERGTAAGGIALRTGGRSVWLLAGAIPLVLAAGCEGLLLSEDGEGPTVDAAITPPGTDAGTPLPGTDAGTPPPGTDAGTPPPGTDAGTPPPGTDAGPDVTPTDAGPPPGPCDGVTCGANERCDAVTGTCACVPGFVDDGGSCVAPPDGDPATRTVTDVCDAWQAGHVENASPDWVAGAGTCDVGTLSPDAIDDTLRRVNHFRWLAGLPPVTHDGSAQQDWNECALMMHVNDMLSHSPPTSWSCYTAGGAGAAGASNIALGYSTSAASIDGYMGDFNTPSLGHRRWILGTRLGAVQIGSAGRGHCLGVFDSSGSSSRAWSAYPNPGPAPRPMLIDAYGRGVITWSFHAYSIGISGATVDVVRVSDGMVMPVDVYSPGGSGTPPTVAFTPDGWTPAAGETYRVTVGGTSAGDITYDVEVVSC